MRIKVASAAAVATAMCFSLPARAQPVVAEGFALDRFDPSERGSDWFAAESLDLRGNLRPAIGIVGDWAYKPLVIYDQNDEEIARVVEHQLFAHIGGGIILADRYRLSLNLPVALVNTGEPGQVATTTYALDEGAGLGDLRVGADVRLFGTYGDVVTAAVGVQAHLPTGSRDAYTGDENVRVVPRALVAGDIGPFAYAGRLGVNIRTLNDNFAGEPFGTELLFAAAGGLRVLDRKLTVGPEIFGSTVMSDSGDGLFGRKTTPFEVIFGGHYLAADSVRIGAGVGPGLTRGIGSPELRVLFGVEWMPAIEEAPPPEVPADTDDDGILDAVDACVDVPGIVAEDPKKHGCPPGDTDGDGILDPEDACVDVAGVPNPDQRLHGCPPPDTDGDGILDADDACVDMPGVPNEDRTKHGCPPPPDKDGDKILDADDACPDQAGEPSTDPKKHGCPKAVIVGTEIKIMERVEFDTGKATLRPESDGVLQAVLNILKTNPGITKVSVHGHTDNRGAPALNKDLSRRRAAAVVKWLTDRGIEANRLESQGFGQDKPIDDNKTEAGRQNNRRVEFAILENKGSTPVETK